jgi:hypothetical protein
MDVLALAIIGSIVGMIVGVGLGASVNVAVGSRVFVGIDVAEGSGVLVDTRVGVAAENPDSVQPVSSESKSTKLKIRIYFNDMLLNEIIIHKIRLTIRLNT